MPEPADEPLSDEAVYRLLHEVRMMLAGKRGQTTRGDSALMTLYRAAIALQLAMVMAEESASDRLPGIIPPHDREPRA